MKGIQIIIYVISAILIVIALYILFDWHNENVKSAKITNDILDNVIIVELPSDKKNIEIINPPQKEEKIPIQYTETVEKPLLDVNLEDFIDQNNDTVRLA